MKCITKILLLAIVLQIFCLPALAAAAVNNNDTLFNGICNGTGSGSVVCQDGGVPGNNTNSNPLLGSDGLLLKVSGIMATIAGVSAIIVAIVAGLSFITSGGDPTKAQNARGTLINAIIGIVVIVLAESIIAFVLTRV